MNHSIDVVRYTLSFATWNIRVLIPDWFQVTKELEISDYCLERSKEEWFHPGVSADFILNGKKFLSFGELHPNLKVLFKIKQPTIIAEGSVEFIGKAINNKEKSSLNIYPLLSLKKDFAFIISSDTSSEQLIEEIKKVDENIGEVTVFDVYKNENKSELSVAIEVEIIQKHKVLNSQEINLFMDAVIKNVEKNLGAKLRVS